MTIFATLYLTVSDISFYEALQHKFLRGPLKFLYFFFDFVASRTSCTGGDLGHLWYLLAVGGMGFQSIYRSVPRGPTLRSCGSNKVLRGKLGHSCTKGRKGPQKGPNLGVRSQISNMLKDTPRMLGARWKDLRMVIQQKSNPVGSLLMIPDFQDDLVLVTIANLGPFLVHQ